MPRPVGKGINARRRGEQRVIEDLIKKEAERRQRGGNNVVGDMIVGAIEGVVEGTAQLARGTARCATEVAKGVSEVGKAVVGCTPEVVKTVLECIGDCCSG